MQLISKYLWNLAIAVDQFCNAVLAGDPDETMSSRFGKWKQADGWRRTVAYAICRGLAKIDKRHCEKSIETDEGDRNIL